MRLGIVSALAVNDQLSFNDLKKLMKTTDGNLSVHARKLEDASTSRARNHSKAACRGPIPSHDIGTPRPRAVSRPQEALSVRRATVSGRRRRLFLDLYFMKQRPLLPAPAPLHVAIIMDGNGRWATSRGQPRAVGHAEGARAVVRIVEAAPALGIGVLTLYAFSADNWRRPPREVASLMRLFRKYLHAETARCVETGVRLTISAGAIVSVALSRAIDVAEPQPSRIDARSSIAIDYSARDAIGAGRGGSGGNAEITVERFAPAARSAYGGDVARARCGPAHSNWCELRVSDFSCGNPRMRSSTSRLACGPSSAPPISARRSASSTRDRRFGGLSEAWPDRRDER